MRYMVEIEKGETSWGAYVPDLPGCVAVGDDTSDLRIDFSGGPRFELFADSSGYESWQIQDPDGQFWVGRNE